MKERLPRSTPEAQGISSTAILDFLNAVDKNIQEFHSFMLLRHGYVIAEGWWKPYAPELPHMMFSLSKSFTSTAIGIAVSEGLLTIDDPIISFFSEDLPAEISSNLRAMRVRHLLAMVTGHHDDTGGVIQEEPDGNWTKAFFAQPVEHEPGTHFLYNSGATFILSALIQKLTGSTLLDYLTPRLFEPLGIENPRWFSNPKGINVGGWGLDVKTEDVACLGQMYLQGGVWQGTRILPEAWVREATSRQSDNGSNPENEWNQGYGYQFWRCMHNAYRGDGAFGQYCIVMPDQDAVLVITGGIADMNPPLKKTWEYLLPAMKEASLPVDIAAQEQLKEKTAALAFQPPQGSNTSPIIEKISGRVYLFQANGEGIKSISFDFMENECAVTIYNEYGEHHFSCGYSVWKDGVAAVFYHPPRLKASGVWVSADTFTMTLRYYETPFIYTIPCKFTENSLSIDGNVNVAFGPREISLVAECQSENLTL